MFSVNPFLKKIKNYGELCRLHRPIGIYLLLWPTLWALWVAAHGQPSLKILFIFMVGVVLMRSAGCIFNDLADQAFDGSVERTKHRPLIAGTVTRTEAYFLFLLFISCAFVLVLFLNPTTIYLAVGALVIACFYPFCKRFLPIPQVVLGLAFAWGIPMAFAAEQNQLSNATWLLFALTAIWIIVYDIQYALVDKEDDLKIGIHSGAIFLGKHVYEVLEILQAVVLVLLLVFGYMQNYGWLYYVILMSVSCFFIYQSWLVRSEKYYQAFENNHWLGFLVFMGIASQYL
jgi:4-hydroxybenzoate polyprenyltransferase